MMMILYLRMCAVGFPQADSTCACSSISEKISRSRVHTQHLSMEGLPESVQRLVMRSTGPGRQMQFAHISRNWRHAVATEHMQHGTQRSTVLESPALVHYAHDLGRRFTKTDTAAAAAAGNLPVLQTLRQQYQCPWDKTTCSAAAGAGHLPVLQWVRAQNPPCPWDRTTCSAAAENGHLHVLQWARSQDHPCPWGIACCSAAAENGHLHVLQWARAQNPACPWSTSTSLGAAEEGQLHVLQWAISHGCPWRQQDCVDAALVNHHFACAEWLAAQMPY